MPPQVGKSALAAKLGKKLVQAFEAHKNDEVEYSQFGELPAGIENGIAQLVECKFDTYKKGDAKGEYFFYAAGVVKRPTEHGGVPIEGLRTSIMEPVYDTPKRSRKTVDDHMKWIINELKKLGLDTGDFKAEDLESAVASLRESAPHFRFRTWKGEKQTEGPYKDQEPRTQHTWNGAVEFSDEEGAGEVADNSATAEEVAPAESNGQFDEFEGSSTSAADETPDAADIEALVSAATEGDEEAQNSLGKIAKEAGVDDDAVENAGSWQEVADLIAEAQGGGGEQEEEETPWEPKKGEVYNYKPLDPKTKKPGKKSVEVEVTAVNKKAKTCDLKNNDNPKLVYKAVAWDSLESAS